MSALDNGISGLNASSTQLDAISHNIANANTTGFKSKSVQFADVYSATGVGGGVYVSDVSTDYAQGALQSSSDVLDMAIQGSGFFMTADASGNTYYTRAGNFELDKDGNIVNSQGLNVQGYAVDASGNPSNEPSNLQIDTSDQGARKTSTVNLAANLDSREDIPPTTPFNSSDSTSYNNTTSSVVYDEQGVAHQVSAYYVKTANNEWAVHYEIDGTALTTNPPTVNVTFNTNGTIATPSDDIEITIPDSMTTGASALTFSMDVSRLSQFGSDFNVTKNSQDGYAPGSYTGMTISEDGGIYATYSNGQTQLQCVVAVAIFPNQGALADAGDTSWKATIESGDPILGIPGEGGAGGIQSKKLESSNVDSTRELVDMVVAQSSYQANAKTISTSNEMTQILMNAV